MRTIKVTQKDIDTGSPDDCELCPIAIAAKRVITDAHIQVSSIVLYVNDDRRTLPPEAQKFVRDFDNGKPVSPMEFEIP